MEYSKIIDRLVQNYNKPAQSLAPDLAQRLKGIKNPADLWDLVRRESLLPETFFDYELRRFGEDNPECVIWPTTRPKEERIPGSLDGIATLLSDPSGILHAESHARELARRLRPWGATASKTVVWYFTNNPYEVSFLGSPFEFAIDSVNCVLYDYQIDMYTFMRKSDEVHLPPLLTRTVAALEGWNLAVQRDFPLNQPPWIDLKSYGSFAETPNPFEMAVELWLTGYRLVADFTEKDNCLRLYAMPFTKFRDMQQAG